MADVLEVVLDVAVAVISPLAYLERKAQHAQERLERAEKFRRSQIEPKAKAINTSNAAAVVTLNENDFGVHAVVAKTLPRFIIIQSNHNHKYLHLYKDKYKPKVTDALQFSGDYSFDPDTRFELVPAKSKAGLFHIRSLLNNKYWRDSFTDGNRVTAVASKRNENESSLECTLFRPVFLYFNNNRVLKLRHVCTNSYVKFHPTTGDSPGMLTLWNGTGEEDRISVYTFIDWESVAVLPKVIRIKCDNGNHLKAYEDGFMDFQFEADNSSLFDFEVSPSRDGGIRLKSVRYGTYWTEMHTADIWVFLKPGSSTGHEMNTVFLPTLVKGNRIMLRSLENDMFCRRITSGHKTDCLASLFTYSDKMCFMEIEEPVLKLKIDNVIYHFADARRYNEKTVALVTDDSTNLTEHELTSSANLKATVTNTTSWSNSNTYTVGAKASFKVGVPEVSEKGIEASIGFEHSTNWGEGTTETLEVGSVYTISVPPRTRVKASLMATRLSFDVPFTYTQREVLKNGKTKVTKKKDGILTVHGGYGYDYTDEKIPLDGKGNDELPTKS